MARNGSAAQKKQAQAPAALRVFLSYSRADVDFADQLDEVLQQQGFEVTLDRHSIAGAEDWKTRLGDLIREADTIVFVLSPDSAGSPICTWEIEEAVRQGKRIIPVLCRPLEPGQAIPGQLNTLNAIYFYRDPKRPRSGFGTGQKELIAALRVDIDWVREHTRIAGLARRWDERGRPRALLARGEDLAEALQWRRSRRPDAPEVRATAEAAGALPSSGHSPVGSGSSFGTSNSGPKGTPWVGRHTLNAVPSSPRTFPSSFRISSSKV